MLWRDLKIWQIYGANTNVGKTVLSTILCKALQRRTAPQGLLYLKPVSTGASDEADDRHIKRHVPDVISQCISQFSQPLSPHLAAQLDNHSLAPKTDKLILSRLGDALKQHAERGGRYALLETAGGVLSPGPSGNLQADLYRPLRLPCLLIGDSELGGIGTTISAFESLQLRGYDVDSVVLFEDPKWGNAEFLNQYFSKFQINTHTVPLPPTKLSSSTEDEAAMSEYYQQCSSSSSITRLVDQLGNLHFSRISKLTSMPSHADAVVWHPFRQHALPQNIIAIDSAYGDNFQVFNQEAHLPISTQPSASPSNLSPLSSKQAPKSLIAPFFDASASWWTQGLGHGNPELSLTAAYAAGRYGHVMFANAVHEPALNVAYNLLSTLQNPRLSRVFFTDNGSTGVEVAVKMALRSSSQRYGWQPRDGGSSVEILGLKGSYHGDTIGVMNCSEPSAFNEKVDWYKPWGHWFDPPQLIMRKGVWELAIPSSMASDMDKGQIQQFDTLDCAFNFADRSSDAAAYETYIKTTLNTLTHEQHRRFGALVFEPLVMGAGGMIFVDPLFQRTLITTIRNNPSLIAPDRHLQSSTADQPTTWSGLPVVADEVFTGLYRLGRASSSSFLSSNPTNLTPSLDIAPDISVHAKLLTGGLLPLALTTASESIFNTFLSDSKADALLHGHSYTAHPIGCSVANKSLDQLNRMNSRGDWESYKSAWSLSKMSISSSTSQQQAPTYSFFSPSTLFTLSNHPRVSGCFAVGTVLALTIRSMSGASAGYTSNAASSLQARLLTTADCEGRSVHSRILGDVIYFMTSLATSPEEVERLEKTILMALDAEK